jgi:excinuclease ABC subunit C
MKKSLKRINLSIEQKENLELISAKKILLRNTFEKNQTEINQLLELSRQNAMIYLQRNRLGQKLSLFEENNLYKNILELQKLLNLKKIPRRIECYDISHLSGKFVYGSMVTFLDGQRAKKLYKLFRCKDQNNDFENHAEVLRRRLKRFLDGKGKVEETPQSPAEYTQKEITKELVEKQKAQTGWELPDLIIVDGGKGQLSSDYKILKELGLENQIEIVGLAKKEEEIFVTEDSNLPTDTKFGSQGGVVLKGQVKFLIQRIRDEAHRFAITNNRKARVKTAQKSQLDDINGVGEKTKTKLLQVFGSTQNLADNLFTNQELVYETVGKNITEKLKKHFGVI